MMGTPRPLYPKQTSDYANSLRNLIIKICAKGGMVAWFSIAVWSNLITLRAIKVCLLIAQGQCLIDDVAASTG